MSVFDRPREKLMAKGPQNLKDHELLAVLLRTGKKGVSVLDLAEEVLKCRKLPQLMEISAQELADIPGIDRAKACLLVAAVEFVKRGLDVREDHNPLIRTTRDAVSLLTDISSLRKEHFMVLYLNARSALIARETVSIGSLNASIVHPREVFEPAVRLTAAAVVIAHNHPSGDADPSDADIAVTKRLSAAGNVLGIEVIDHIIVTAKTYYSFKEHSML